MTTHVRRAVRFGALLALASLLMVFVAACGGDDDTTGAATNTTGAAAGSTATKSSSGATSTTSSSGAAATSTTAAAPEATATTGSASDATATTGSEPEATATTEEAAEPTATTESEEATATTGDDTATPADDEDPLADYHPLDPDQLPNFTLTADYESQGTSTDETEDGTFSMVIQQSAVDNFHTKIDTGDPTEGIETWGDNGMVWVSYGGEIQELPEQIDPSVYSPSSMLTQVPEIADQLAPSKVGEDNVSGRKATHYKATPEEFLDLMSSGSDSDYLNGATDAEGNVEIWIDNDLKIIMKLDVDVTWTNADGSPGKAVETYLISDIGSTAHIDPPQ